MSEQGAAIDCWLCGRPMGEQIEWHHPVPKAKKGRVKVQVHPICHRTIHANFTNSELGRMGADRDLILANEAVAKFVTWVSGKPPDFHAPTRS
jgi:hypothetical protein